MSFLPSGWITIYDKIMEAIMLEGMKECLYISLRRPKIDNNQGTWNVIRNAVSVWYFTKNNLTDDKLRDILCKGSVEIAFNPPSENNPV